ncbi:MAG: MscS family membrane protein [Thermoproteota archaeon]|jgi:MscS family membrane protein
MNLKLHSILILLALTTLTPKDSSAEVFNDMTSIRGTFKTFLKNMVKVKNAQDPENIHIHRALRTLDNSHLDSTIRYQSSVIIAKQLINTFDKLEKIDYKNLPDLASKKLKENYWIYSKRKISVDGKLKDVEVSLRKIKSKWFFSKETLDSIKYYERFLKKSSAVKDIVILSDWRSRFKSKLPSWFESKNLFFTNGQWIGLICILLIGLILDRIMRFIAAKILMSKLGSEKINIDQRTKEKFIAPFGFISFSLFWYFSVRFIEIEPSQLAVLVRLGHIMIAVSSVWLLHYLVDIFALYFDKIAQRTETKFDDILVPLMRKAARMLVYSIGLIFVAHSLTINVTNVIAGLGIGGLAFALAAKDTLSNLFGSLTVVLDRPFQIGDSIIIDGNVEGTVVEVGFRSTRVRTFYDSITTIPNSLLTNAHIDNYGQRRYRRLSTSIGIEYDTSPEKIEAFCEGVRQIIINHPATRKDYFNVYLNNMGSASLDILLYVFWEVPDYSQECAEKHRLYIDIIRLAQKLGIGFAFPTQTLHVFNEEKSNTENAPENYFSWASEEAKNISSSPISYEKSRSSEVTMKQDTSK